MSANYLHGIESIEVERGPRAIRVVKSAVIALVGTDRPAEHACALAE